MPEQLIQTRVPQPVGEWVSKAAEEEGISVAAWMRRAVMGIAAGTRVDAWLARPGENLAGFHYSPPRPYVALQLLKRGDAGRCLFVVLHSPTHSHAGQPWSEHWFKDSELFKAQQERVLVLRGSPVPWRMLSSMFDSSAQHVLVLAEPVPEPSRARVLLDDLEDFVRRRLVSHREDPSNLVLGVTQDEELVLLAATAADVGADLAARVLTEGPRRVFATLFGVTVAWGAKNRTIGSRKS